MIDHHSSPVETTTFDHDLVELVRDLARQVDPPAAMKHVVRWAVQTIPNAQHASVALTKRRRTLASAATTSDLARRFEVLQQTLGQGPCLQAMYEHRSVRVDDLAVDERWPALAEHCSEVGVRSALCLQLFVHRRHLGTLSVLSEQPCAFDDEAEQWGLVMASHAAVAISTAFTIEGLSRANANRTVIGQAEGILMERLKVSPEVAFAVLTRISQDTNRKLHHVAEDLVSTGQVPVRTTYPLTPPGAKAHPLGHCGLHGSTLPAPPDPPGPHGRTERG